MLIHATTRMSLANIIAHQRIQKAKTVLRDVFI